MTAPGTSLTWRVDRRMTVLKAAGALVFVVAAVVLGGDVAGTALALLVAAGLAAFAARDMLAPVRLAADARGVTVVSGFASRRHIPWSAVERVRVDVRQRLGRRSELLEIDTGETLHLFSTTELGTGCDEVAAALATLRTGR
jgi:hypothetical protein